MRLDRSFFFFPSQELGGRAQAVEKHRLELQAKDNDQFIE